MSMFENDGFLERVPNANAPEGFDLAMRAPFNYGGTLWERLQLRQKPLHKLIMWRAIRHEFLFPQGLRGEDAVLADPDIGLISFASYLRGRLGKTVLALVELDLTTWCAALVLMAAIVYLCRSLPMVGVAAVQCGACWLLALTGLLLTVVLEEDTYELTPTVPQDVRQTLRLFAGTSSQMLRRLIILRATRGISDPPNPVNGYLREENERSAMGRRFRPGLGDADTSVTPTLTRTPEFQASAAGEERWYPSSETYANLLRFLTFAQAICVTSLIVSFLSIPPNGWVDTFLYTLAWVEWPVLLFFIAPPLIRRLTVRSSIESEKDKDLLRSATLTSKESLLRDFVRALQIAGLERRARQAGEPWTLGDGSSWTRAQAAKAYQQGIRDYESLPDSDKEEIWNIFATLDCENDGVVQADEISDMIGVAGCCTLGPGLQAAAEMSTNNLVRLVGHDRAPFIRWDQFKAITALATINRPAEELQEDLGVFFASIDEDGDDIVNIFELAEGLQEMRIPMNSDDVSNLWYRHFGKATSEVCREDFTEWIVSE